MEQGSLESVAVEPREVFKAAMINNAYTIIVFHNHPGCEPEPSARDLALTRRLKDYLIIGEGKYVSLKEEKLL